MGLKSSGSRSSIRNISENIPPGFALTNQGATIGIPDSGVSRWTFDSADTDSGTALDTWGSNDGTINGATTGVTGANQTYATAEAYSFDGTDDNLRAPITYYNPTTYAFWVKTSGTSIQCPFGITPTGDNNPRFQFFINATEIDTQSTGSLFLFIQDDSSNTMEVEFTGDGGYVDGNYHHITVAVDSPGQDVQFYIDGETVSTNIKSDDGLNSSEDVSFEGEDMAFGSRINNGSLTDYLSGELDDLRVYSKRLSDQEVSNLYNNGDIRVN
jgi:hypothetical protein